MNCKACGSNKNNFLLNWRIFKIYKCRNCSLVFSDPLPTDHELNKFYQGFLFKKPKSSDIIKHVAKRKKEIIKLFNLTLKDYSSKRFLDYGGGTGVTFGAIKNIGFDAYYFDLDQEAINFTREQFNLSKENTIIDINNCPKKFNYILSDNVIEHVKDPVEFIKTLYLLLDKNGTLIIKTPHARNLELFFNPYISVFVYFTEALKYNSLFITTRAFFKRFWHCAPPRHLYAFSKKSLFEMVKSLNVDDFEYEVSTYSSGWFSNTFSQKHFNCSKSKIVKTFFLSPIFVFETILQTLKIVLLKFKIISTVGTMLIINKKKSV